MTAIELVEKLEAEYLKIDPQATRIEIYHADCQEEDGSVSASVYSLRDAKPIEAESETYLALNLLNDAGIAPGWEPDDHTEDGIDGMTDEAYTCLTFRVKK